MSFAPIGEILDELRAGRMIVLVDDEQRENEGDLVAAADRITAETVNFMTKYARGVLCVALEAAACDRLDLTPQSPVNTAQLGTAFTVTVDAAPRFGVTTGVSAADRATTIRLLADPATHPADLSRPGHINPLRAREGGVLVRTGQTEGSVDLCRLAGLPPAGAIIEIMNDDGSMARLPELKVLCERHHLKMCTVADIVAYRLGREKLVERIAEVPIDTECGPFRLIAYRSMVDALPHVALVTGRVGQQEITDPVLVRVHAQNILTDVFGTKLTPTGGSLREAMRLVQTAGEGAVVYMRQDAMGSGLLRRLQSLDESQAPAVQREMSAETATNIGIGSQILRDLGIRKLKLLANNPHHYHGLEGFGLSIDEFVKIG
ncbi:MAG: 3,4-dihydroxy-2-butanone-4-phosphate synthase [Planctomycetes bacterium]|nr:3,4-dihydroxy-2-butanone-4-phosphate synthase [Planctomycetota bacterium]